MVCSRRLVDDSINIRNSSPAIVVMTKRGLNHVSVVLHASIIWRMQRTAMLFCTNQTYFAGAVLRTIIEFLKTCIVATYTQESCIEISD